jgi:hypothetical protein
MSANSELFIERLGALIDVDTDDYLEGRLYDLCSLIEKDPDSSSVIPHIFAFFEAHPKADFGAPGPLVHFLEKQPDYEEYLMESIARKPTAPPIWMINRILNVTIPPEKRTTLLNMLQSVLANPNADEYARDQAENYLTYQAGRRRS